MTRPDADRPGREPLSDQELLVAELVGRCIERREHGHGPDAQDLVAVAAEHGDAAVNILCYLLACYEAGRAHLNSDHSPNRTDRQEPRPNPTPHMIGAHRRRRTA